MKIAILKFARPNTFQSQSEFMPPTYVSKKKNTKRLNCDKNITVYAQNEKILLKNLMFCFFFVFIFMLVTIEIEPSRFRSVLRILRLACRIAAAPGTKSSIYIQKKITLILRMHKDHNAKSKSQKAASQRRAQLHRDRPEGRSAFSGRVAVVRSSRVRRVRAA